ncbi:MAG: tetraacyldisaccharide 4'-kinase [Planctomycetes bacterium]|nr:tetraacyldisaccharide 4'-kinase [Planctomycetota bacterium]
MNARRWIPILSGEDRSIRAAVMRVLLLCAEPFYGLAIHARNLLFNCRLRRGHKLGRTTISVGNITTGGTGKTPVVADLARRLIAMNARPAVLLRGYLDDDGRSDEADVLIRELGSSVPVIAKPDRRLGARIALQHNPAVTVFLLDDGFQRRQVHRDLDLVLIDATNPFGHGHLLPRGLLREPLSGLRRARGIIVTRADLITPDALWALDRTIAERAGRPPIAHAAHVWTGFLDAKDQLLPIDALRARRVIAVTGIGNPDAFETTLRQHAAAVIHHAKLDDHHNYADLNSILPAICRTASTDDILVTTEKDWVKWKPRIAGAKTPLPVYRPVLGIRYLDGEVAVDNLLRHASAIL